MDATGSRPDNVRVVPDSHERHLGADLEGPVTLVVQVNARDDVGVDLSSPTQRARFVELAVNDPHYGGLKRYAALPLWSTIKGVVGGLKDHARLHSIEFESVDGRRFRLDARAASDLKDAWLALDDLEHAGWQSLGSGTTRPVAPYMVWAAPAISPNLVQNPEPASRWIWGLKRVRVKTRDM